MSLLPFFKKKPIFSAGEQEQIVEAVRAAEKQTSGEVRVFVETHCKFVDPIDRAAEIFHQLQMEKTADRNGVLVYVAIKDRQLAVYGDAGIHEKVGEIFWEQAVRGMLTEFNRENYIEGISRMIEEIGEALKTHFPYQGEMDKNELPDDIVFGR